MIMFKSCRKEEEDELDGVKFSQKLEKIYPAVMQDNLEEVRRILDSAGKLRRVPVITLNLSH